MSKLVAGTGGRLQHLLIKWRKLIVYPKRPQPPPEVVVHLSIPRYLIRHHLDEFLISSDCFLFVLQRCIGFDHQFLEADLIWILIQFGLVFFHQFVQFAHILIYLHEPFNELAVPANTEALVSRRFRLQDQLVLLNSLFFLSGSIVGLREKLIRLQIRVQFQRLLVGRQRVFRPVCVKIRVAQPRVQVRLVRLKLNQLLQML